MTFWFVFAAMAVLVTALLARALLRGQKDAVEGAKSYDIAVYRDQLAEVERDVARGVISAEDAERTRTEISRRILAADRAAQDQREAQAGPGRALVAVLAVLLVGGSLGGYALLGQPGYGDMALRDRLAFAEEVRQTRSGQEVAMAAFAQDRPAPSMTEEEATLLAQLRETAAARPEDAQLQRYLAQYETLAENFEAAIAAQRRVLEIKGNAVTARDLGDFAELLVLSAGGYVSPEAEAVLRNTLALDETDGRARYYIALMMDQTGRPDLAFRIWDALLREGPVEAPWIPAIRAQIPRAAALAGVEYEMPRIGSGRAPGPSSEDIEAAAAMTPQERMQMIGGMVESLSDRLGREGGPVEDWARLIASLGVLGQRAQSAAIYAEALEVFASDLRALDLLTRAAERAGIDG